MAKTRNAEANNNGKGGKSKKADNAESMGKAKNTGKAGRAVSDGNVGRIGKDGKAVKDGQVGQAVKAEKEHTEAELRAQLESLEHPALLLVLDGITDPRNLGACLRSADAAGADAVIVPRSNAAGLTPAARKVACGAAETIPLIRVANLARALGDLKQRGIWLFGATADAPASLYDADLSAPLALILGAEDAGLRRLTIEACDHLIRLPMRGAVPSLNVSVAAGICLYEAARQRSAARLCE